jgi:hypothetical protein
VCVRGCGVVVGCDSETDRACVRREIPAMTPASSLLAGHAACIAAVSPSTITNVLIIFLLL